MPGGLAHASCVHALAEGDTLGDDGSVHRANGKVETFGSCAYPRYTSDGVKVESTTDSDLSHSESSTPDSLGKAPMVQEGTTGRSRVGSAAILGRATTTRDRTFA